MPITPKTGPLFHAETHAVADPAPRNMLAGTQTLTLSDRPELRLDPTTLVTTGAIANTAGAQVYSVEAAATYRESTSGTTSTEAPTPACRRSARRGPNSRADMRKRATS